MKRLMNTVAVAPLVSDAGTVEHSWLGASLGKLLSEHLSGAGLPVMHYNAVGEATLKLDKALPLDKDGIEAVMKHLKLSSLVAGGFRLEKGQLHLSISVTSADATPAPLTDSAPTTSFAPQVERVTMALVERLGFPLDEKARRRMGQVPRPRSFAAFQQMARARAAWAEEDFPLALSLLESALQLEPTLEEAGEIKIGIGRAAGRPQVVREGFELWAKLAGRNGHPLVRAERLLLYGHWEVGQGDWDRAESAYRTALKAYQERNQPLGEAQALDNIAGLSLRRGNPDEAVAAYRKSIAVYEKLGAKQETATATYNLALGHKAQGDGQAALRALDRTLKMAGELKEQSLEAAALDQRGVLRADEGNSAGAQADYERAVKLYEQSGDLAGLATVKDHLATLLAQDGDHAAAEALRLEAVALFEGLGDEHELAVAWANLAALYVEMGAFNQAWDYAERAHAVFTRLGSGMQEITARLLDGLS
jgi:tetratricopeptide (TPR) repeat protein